jgi:pimeloyl-ACP methyl ester carboxylesterase
MSADGRTLYGMFLSQAGQQREPAATPGIRFLDLGDGRRLATRKRDGGAPTIVFLPGYASGMEGSKAVALDAFAADRGLGMLRFDYSGTGSSAGEFADGTLGRWLEDALAAVDRLSEGPLVVAGSSMGGWLALHLALLRPGRVRGLVGIAAAPDFTDWGYSDEDRRVLADRGRLERDNPYGPDKQLTTREFWQSGVALRLLDGPITIGCPVRLLHGDADEDVPTTVGLQLAQLLRSDDVQLILLKGGGHRLSAPHELRALRRAVDDLVELAR